jgi:hypothetical protein
MIIRVFPRKTNMTPDDPYVFVGDPPLWRPEADEAHISVTFTWDIEEGRRLWEAWAQYYPVRLGGPAFSNGTVGDFTPGLYVKQGVTFTSRGCNNNCPWCLVPQMEGKLRHIPITPGHIVQDNNLLQCSAYHRRAVFQMLKSQRKGAVFAGGLDARLLTDEVADELRGLRIHQIFLAADTEGALKPLAGAIQKLSFLGRQKTRCFVLIAYNGETIKQAEVRLRCVWELGAMPFAQLYQPPDEYIRYSHEWKALARTWSRPAATKALMAGIGKEG